MNIPDSVDEPVHVVEYDSAWRDNFSREQMRIAEAVGIDPARVEHIGSTAVRGLSAKPIVDIMLGSGSWPPNTAIGEAIARLGYEALGEAGVPERLYFRRRDLASYNLHVVRFGGQHWRSNIALRDYLRRNDVARNRYAQAKRSAVLDGANTLLAYSEAKASVVTTLLREALAADRGDCRA